MAFPDSDDFNTRGLRELYNVICSPVWVGIEGVDNRFPGIKSHNLGEHVWIVNLNNEAIERGRVDSIGGGNDLAKLGGNEVWFSVLGVSDNIDVGVLMHKMDQLSDVNSVIFAVNEG